MTGAKLRNFCNAPYDDPDDPDQRGPVRAWGLTPSWRFIAQRRRTGLSVDDEDRCRRFISAGRNELGSGRMAGRRGHGDCKLDINE